MSHFYHTNNYTKMRFWYRTSNYTKIWFCHNDDRRTCMYVIAETKKIKEIY